MTAILIVEDDGLIAGHFARSLRQAGRMPILAHDARSVLQETLDRPDAILVNPLSPEEAAVRLREGRQVRLGGV